MVIDIYDALVGIRVGEGVRVTREYKLIHNSTKSVEASAEIRTSMESRQRHLVDKLRSQEKHNTWNWVTFLYIQE